MMVEKSVEQEWIQFYEETAPEELPWESGEPAEELVGLIRSGKIKIGKALDICCGVGTQAVYLAEKGFEVIGIDISPKAIEYAREKARAAGVKVDFIVGDSVNLTFPDEEFDFVFDRGGFHHIPFDDREAYIEGVHRVLKKGGNYHLICFSDKNGPAWNHFSASQIRDYLSKIFKILSIEPTVFVEKSGAVRYFYSVFAEKLS